VLLVFTTANDVAQAPRTDFLAIRVLAAGRIDRLFLAAEETAAEAVLDALAAAEATVGRDGNRRLARRLGRRGLL
jgi:D-aminopeptidase